MRDYVAAVDAYILECFQRQTSPRVDELAFRLTIHPSVLSRNFRAKTGRLLSAVLKERQLEEARRLLIGTTLPMHDVARRAGFGTPNTMFRLFRRLGITPQEYRRRSR
jgi:AraC-like DNA-binding protein